MGWQFGKVAGETTSCDGAGRENVCFDHVFGVAVGLVSDVGGGEGGESGEEK